MSDEESTTKRLDSAHESVNLTEDTASIDSEQREARREALLGMLKASTNRQNAAKRRLKPKMAIGEHVAVVKGELNGQTGVILDADFIHDKAQLEITVGEDPVWVSFSKLTFVDKA